MIRNKEQQKNILILALISIISTSLFAYIAYIIEQNSIPSFFGIWNQWDTPHYLDIAQFGYQNFGEMRYWIVFFPLYPALINIFNFFFSNYILSALFVANLFYIIAIIFFYKLLLIDYQERIAFKSILFLSIFPTAYFLHAGYTESIFLTFIILSFYFARKDKWFWAGCTGMMAMLCRINGLTLFPALLIEYLVQKKFQLKFIKSNILWLMLIPLGFLIYLAINYFVSGNAFIFLRYLKEFWGKSLIWPWIGLIGAINDFSWRPAAEIITVSGASIFFAILGLILIILGIKKINFSYSIFAFLNCILITSTSFWLSIPRYLITIFPIFIVLAFLGQKRKWNYLITFISLILYTIFLTAFVQGKWAF